MASIGSNGQLSRSQPCLRLRRPNVPFTREQRRGAEGATELLVGVQWLVGRVPVAFHTRGLPPVAPPIVATASVIVSSDSSSA